MLDPTLDAVRRARRRLEQAQAAFHRSIVDAYEADPVRGRQARIAKTADLTPGRVSQIITADRKAAGDGDHTKKET